MSSSTVRKGAIAALGAAAGSLAVAAFVGTAPTASADNNGNTIDYTALAAPAVTYPDFTYTNEFEVFNGTNSYDVYTTTYDGTGSPTTTMAVETLPSGEVGYGSADTFSSAYDTSATAGYDFTSSYDLYDIVSSTGSTDYFVPLYDVFSSFS